MAQVKAQLTPLFNSVADASKLGEFVLDKFNGTNMEYMPDRLVKDTEQLAYDLAEAMYTNRVRLEFYKDSPMKEAETERLVDLHRTYNDRIPPYRERIKEYETGMRKVPDFARFKPDKTPLGPLKMEVDGF